MKRLLLSVLVLGLVPVAQGLAQQDEEASISGEEDAEAQYRAFAQEVLKDVAPEHGSVALNGAPVRLEVPSYLDFYDGRESRKILEDLWGNPPDSSVLGMLFPAGESPAEAIWGAALTYEESGYVSDADAADMDFDKLLRDMQRDTQSVNPERAKQGYATIELTG